MGLGKHRTPPPAVRQFPVQRDGEGKYVLVPTGGVETGSQGGVPVPAEKDSKWDWLTRKNKKLKQSGQQGSGAAYSAPQDPKVEE